MDVFNNSDNEDKLLGSVLGKHVSKRGNMRIANCPHCRGVLFKELNIEIATGEVSFLMRCPHCQKNIIVTINHEISLRMPQ